MRAHGQQGRRGCLPGIVNSSFNAFDFFNVNAMHMTPVLSGSHMQAYNLHSLLA